MKPKSKVLQAIKHFSREIDAPDDRILDAAEELKLLALRIFFSKMGTTIKVLEKLTTLDSKSELYIGII